MKLVLLILSSLLIKFHAQIIDSLLAIAICFVYLINLNVGSNPSKPTMSSLHNPLC